MAGKRAPKLDINLDALTGDLAALRMIAGDEMMSQACELLRANMGMTAESLMLVLKRRLFPERHIQKGEETELRGVSENTLKTYKDAKMLPEFIGFAIPPTPTKS